MTELLATTLAVITPPIAILLAVTAMGRTWSVTPLLLFVVTSVLFINIGFITFFLRNSSEPWALTAVLSVTLGLLAVSLGGLVGASIFRATSRWTEITRLTLDDDLPYGIALVTAGIVFGVVLLYFYLLGYVPLISGIKKLLSQGFATGLVNTFRLNRDVYFNPEMSYIPMQGFMEAVRYNGLPVVALWFLHFVRRGVRTRLSAFLVVFSAVLIMATGQRWPLMNMLVVFLIYWSWTESSWKQYRAIFRRTAIVACLVGVLLSALLGRTTNAELGPLGMVVFGAADLFERILVGNAEIPFASYEIFPSQEGWLYGWSWTQNLLAYLPGPMPSFPMTFHQLVTGSSWGFTAPPDFYTEAYINFGWFGVLGLSFLWGVFLSAIQGYITRTRLSVVRVSLLAVLVTIIGFSSISGVMFSLGAVIVAVFILGLIMIQRVFFSRLLGA